MKKDNLQNIFLEDFRDMSTRKGNRFAFSTSLAAIFVTVGIGSPDKETMEKVMAGMGQKLKMAPKESIKDAVEIANIYIDGENLSLEEAADIYFKLMEAERNEEVQN